MNNHVYGNKNNSLMKLINKVTAPFKLSIRIKLVLVLSVLLSILAAAIGSIMIDHQKKSLEDQMRSLAGTITIEFSNNSKMPLLQDDRLTMNVLVQNLMNYQGIINAYILDENFFIKGHKELEKVGIEYYRKEDILNTAGPYPWIIKENEDTLTFASPIIFKKTQVGHTIVVFSKIFIKQKIREARSNIILITVFAVIAVFMLSIPLASGLLNPIFRLLKGTKEIALGKLWYRIHSDRSDEIGDLILSFNQMASELEKKELLKGVFDRYVSKPIADEILKNPEKIHLAGDRREATVLFADIRGFTGIALNMQPEEIVGLLNNYFTTLTEIIFHFNGTVDKFIGDAVMGVFGSPLYLSGHLEYGVKAAFGINKALEQINRLRAKRKAVQFPMGIGLDSGFVVAGSMGSKVRMEYTVIGNTVNAASRLSDIAKGGEILVSKDIYAKIADNVTAVEMSELTMKGLEKYIPLYNIIGLKEEWEKESRETVHMVMNKIAREGIAF
jgi:adenylate cyclase